MSRCDSCGQHAAFLIPCSWDSRLLVGECCEFHFDDLIETPVESVCEAEAQIFCVAKTVRDVVAGIRMHRMNCPVCSAFPMPVDLWAGETRRGVLHPPCTVEDPARQVVSIVELRCQKALRDWLRRAA
jgi:hypothetical protein